LRHALRDGGRVSLDCAKQSLCQQHGRRARVHRAAANIFGGWNPLGSFLASLLFAFAQALRINLSLPIPDQFVQMVPYALTLLCSSA
jgi:hypothetical protein